MLGGDGATRRPVCVQAVVTAVSLLAAAAQSSLVAAVPVRLG